MSIHKNGSNAMKKNIEFSFLTLLFGLLFFISINSNLSAQEIQDDNDVGQDSSLLKTDKRLPILNSFRFIPSDVIRDPFINTFVKVNVGTGAALDLKSYIKNLEGTVFDTLSGDLTYISAELEFQYAVNEWLAFNGSYGGAGRLGTNAYTILTSGIAYATSFTLGAKVKIWQNDKMFLASSIDYTSSEVIHYSIYDFVKEVYESGGKIDSSKNSLLEKDNLPKTFLNLNYAYAPTDWFGLLGVAGFGIGQTFKSKDKGNIRIGVAASIDFLNIDFVSFPIGILASIRYNSFSETGEDIKNLITLGFRIGYSGHKDFDIGIENTYQSLNFRLSEQKVQTIITAFKMRYYF